MKRRIKSSLLLTAGFCWIAAAFAIGVMLVAYLSNGAGLQFAGFLPLSPLTTLLGLAQFTGIVAGGCLCLVVGVGLCAHGLALPPEDG